MQYQPPNTRFISTLIFDKRKFAFFFKREWKIQILQAQKRMKVKHREEEGVTGRCNPNLSEIKSTKSQFFHLIWDMFFLNVKLVFKKHCCKCGTASL